MNNFGVGAMYIHRKYHNFCGSAQQGCVGGAVRYLDSSANYTGPVAFTAACGNSLCAQSSYTGFYFNGPTLHSNTIEENISQYRTYSGLELTARKRMSNHWMMTTSYVYNRERNYALTPDSWTNLDPTNRQPVDLLDGFEDGQRNAPHVFKLMGMYQLPYDITASSSFGATSGNPFNPSIVGPTRANGLGTATMAIHSANSQRLPAIRILDLNFDKAVRFGGARRVTLNAAIFNLLNDNTTLALAAESTVNGIRMARQNTSTANFLNTIVGPRVVRFGARFNF